MEQNNPIQKDNNYVININVNMQLPANLPNLQREIKSYFYIMVFVMILCLFLLFLFMQFLFENDWFGISLKI